MTVKSTTQATDLIDRYLSVRRQSLNICAPLQPEDYVVQPIDDVSPPKWHLGHITWFFENFILIEHAKNYKPFDLRLNWFFNSYYEAQGARILRSNRGNMTRPDLQTVLDYRKHVDTAMQDFLANYQGIFPTEIAKLVEVGLQHEQQHQELLVTDIKYILGTNPYHPAYRETQPKAAAPPPAMSFLSMQEGIYEIGYTGEDFCWDNELSVHKVYLHDYEVADRLVTNSEYLEFMQAGGYENHAHWLSEGWEYAKNLEEKAPLYWYKKNGDWWQYTMQGLQKVDANLPVTHISYFEADAYAAWKGMRLPTEFEWEAACRKYHGDTVPQGNFSDDGIFHPTAKTDKNDLQMLGQTWEWTSSAYLPYPDYPRFKGALGEYNGKFMVNQTVLRGGSCATPRSHIRLTYRNFFQTDKRWQFTGIRLAR